MRQLYYQMVSRGYVPNTTRDNCHKRTSGKALCGASDKCLTPSGGGKLIQLLPPPWGYQ